MEANLVGSFWIMIDDVRVVLLQRVHELQVLLLLFEGRTALKFFNQWESLTRNGWL